MSQVYVHFHPILVEVPDNVILALGSDRDKKLAQQVAANLAHSILTNRINSNVALKYVETVVKA